MSQPISSAPHDISSPHGKKLLDQYRDILRLKHYSSRAEDTYVSRETHWQYIFPAPALSADPVSKKTMRHHADESLLQKAVRAAAKAAEIDKRVTPHTFRQCGAYL